MRRARAAATTRALYSHLARELAPDQDYDAKPPSNRSRIDARYYGDSDQKSSHRRHTERTLKKLGALLSAEVVVA